MSRSRRCHAPKGRPRQPIDGTLPDDLYDYIRDPAPRRSPRRRDAPPDMLDIESLPVVDDWPDKVPITEEEIAVFEAWFGDIFDEMFGPEPPDDPLTKLSKFDN